MARRLGDILIERGAITDAQLQSALASQGSKGGMLGVILVRRGLITAEQLGAALEEQFEVPFRRLVPEAVNSQVTRLLPEDLARSSRSVPIAAEKGILTLAMVAPDDIKTIYETELITGYRVEPVVALEGDVLASLERGFDERVVARQTIVDMKLADLEASEQAKQTGADPVNIEDDDAPVVRLVRAILVGAINAGASDIHLEPQIPAMRVRYRVDGDLQQVMTIPDHIEEAVVARIKVMADMDTTENRRPQDGHVSLNEADTKANLRVSTIPTVGGEKVVMRVLDEGNRLLTLDQLGLQPADGRLLQTLIDKPHGMFVVTGPTGSGKTTTMYAVLTMLNREDRNIVTIEEPVEYRLPGINQVASDNEFGMGFANALKFIMRQDPNVIMVGEIRDDETAGLAVQAALTGHLLISTLHTNDAVGAVARLNDLGIDPFKLGGALLGSIAQRLLRAICPECKEPVEPNAKLLRALAGDQPVPADTTFFHGRGCKKCLGTGYSGRFAIFEIMLVSPVLAEAVEGNAPSSKLREIALAEGMVGLSTAGLNQAIAGRTTIEEVFYKVSS
ncbi:MAG: Flp pilus assembly complex ATPase component TadA [Planctomycetes bacterium]|nr:Flp pilus assembly complex ATPase component TadA [Planctomycetota bacterium]